MLYYFDIKCLFHTFLEAQHRICNYFISYISQEYENLSCKEWFVFIIINIFLVIDLEMDIISDRFDD
jgi:hypothetical protein